MPLLQRYVGTMRIVFESPNDKDARDHFEWMAQQVERDFGAEVDEIQDDDIEQKEEE